MDECALESRVAFAGAGVPKRTARINTVRAQTRRQFRSIHVMVTNVSA